MEIDNKKGIIISSYFPPENNGAIGRIVSLYNYLPEDGIIPYIITKNVNELDRDRVIRVRSINDYNNEKSVRLLYEKIRRKILFQISTEEDRVWEEFAYKEIRKLLLTEKIDFIYATFPTFSTFRIANMIKKNHNIPLILEYRDGLSCEPLYKMNFIKQIVARKFEANIIAKSSLIITVGKVISKCIENKYSNCNIFTIRNGFIEDDYNKSMNIKKDFKDKKIVICNFGNWNKSRKGFDIKVLVKSLDLEIYSQTLKIVLFGNYTKREKSLLLGLNKKYSTEMIDFKGISNKDDGFKFIQNQCDVLLLLGIKNVKGFISQKLLEYLNLNKPIIGICKNTEAEDIINRAKVGEVCDFNVPEIRGLLNKSINRALDFNPDLVYINRYNRRVQTHEIALLLRKYT